MRLQKQPYTRRLCAMDGPRIPALLCGEQPKCSAEMGRKSESPGKIAVAMSGGVDSAAAALLVRNEGCEIEGVTMAFGIPAEGSEASRRLDSRDIADAERTCTRLGIAHRVVDFRSEMEEEVIRPFISEYLRGQTPNPCILCNRQIKFGRLLDEVLSLGFNGLATGHYAALEQVNGTYRLKKPKDLRKDQTYFLYAIARERLSLLRFPLAEYTKDEVRTMVSREGLPLSDKKESQDVCFIPAGNCEGFLRSRGAPMREGDIVDSAGRILGRHRGIGCYTIGQRGGMGISSPFPLYVTKIDVVNNRLVAGNKEDLNARELIAGDVNWLVEEIPMEADAKIRYGHRGAKCHITATDSGRIHVRFTEEQMAVSPGQSIVFYDHTTVLGGGVIKEALSGTI